MSILIWYMKIKFIGRKGVCQICVFYTLLIQKSTFPPFCVKNPIVHMILNLLKSSNSMLIASLILKSPTEFKVPVFKIPNFDQNVKCKLTCETLLRPDVLSSSADGGHEQLPCTVLGVDTGKTQLPYSSRKQISSLFGSSSLQTL